MFPASTIGGGQCMAMPDVCKVPAPPAPFVPTPFPNIAQLAQGNPSTASSKVIIGGSPAFHKGSMITMTSGDEAGTLMGMISATVMGPAAPKLASMKVKVEGNGLVYVTCMFAHNGSNANAPAGTQMAPSQTVVLTAQ